MVTCTGLVLQCVPRAIGPRFGSQSSCVVAEGMFCPAAVRSVPAPLLAGSGTSTLLLQFAQATTLGVLGDEARAWPAPTCSIGAPPSGECT